MKALKPLMRWMFDLTFDTLARPYIVKAWEAARINQINQRNEVIPCPYCGSTGSEFVSRWVIDHPDFFGLFDDSQDRLRVVYGLSLKRFMPSFLYLKYREKALETLLGRSHIDYRRCLACDLTFQNYPHTAQSVNFYYRELYRARHLDRDARSGVELYGRDDRRWIGQQAQIGRYFLQATGLAAPARVLEIGCAEGWACKYLQDNGITAFGIEPSIPMVNYARQVLGLQNVIAASYTTDSYPAESFDGAFSHHVIEHIYDLRGLLSALAKHLKIGGYVLVQTPCIDNVQPPHSYGRVLSGGHIYGFSEKFLRQAFASHGFEVLECRQTPCDLAELGAEDVIADLGISAWADDPCGISVLARKK